ncbi:PTS system IIA component domain-containing protein, partial [Listeria ivanovii FSL F6-596]
EEGLPVEGGNNLHFIVVIAAVDKNAHFTALLQLMELSENKKALKKLADAKSTEEMHQIIKNFTDLETKKTM